ncbi:MAG: response regulator transcription factor [Nitrospirae bacterium]|jgi:DNA-binding NarL/FixJ family response regulator|nr:response regulator transcription factor [Nitrospirota bacterium]
MINLVIADDHQIFRQGLVKMLKDVSDFNIIGETGNGTQALEIIIKTKPDIAILDISLPDLNGFEIAAAIQKKGVSTRVIFLTMHNDSITAKKAIQSFGDGYVIKDNAFEDLLYAIKSVRAGGKFISPSVSNKLINVGAPAESLQIVLTEREKQILSLIASGLTNRQIADKLFISMKTVETHRNRILQKLGVHTTADMVRYAIKSGLFELK